MAKSSDSSTFSAKSSGSGRFSRSLLGPISSDISNSIDNNTHRSVIKIIEAASAIPIPSNSSEIRSHGTPSAPHSLHLRSEKSSDFKSFLDPDLPNSFAKSCTFKDWSGEEEPFDLKSARDKFAHCTTAEDKLEVKKNLRPKIIKRLKELSEMESTSNVGLEIAQTIEFLKVLNYSDMNLEKLIQIRQTILHGVMSLDEGFNAMKKSLDLLQSSH